MPADIEHHVLNWLGDDATLALCQRGVLNQRKLDEWIFFAPRPIAVKLFGHLENLWRVYVASNYQRRVVRHVIALLNRAHHGGGRGRDCLPVTERVLPARVF